MRRIHPLLIVALLIALFLFIRLFRFQETFHFYYDQPLFSIKALEIWQSKHIPLIGPPISFVWEGRQVFQGGIVYVTQLIFLLIGGFDPMRSTLAFIIFAGLMMIPLWDGVKRLYGAREASLVGIFYACFPPLVTGTLEMTNPYYQLALTPILIWILSKYVTERKWSWGLLTGIITGLLLQYHYQLVVVIGLIIVYLFTQKPKLRIYEWILIGIGMGVGYAPMILFELRNNFYNLRTIGLFIEHWDEFKQQFGGGLPSQYFLSFMLMITALVSGKLSKLPNYLLIFGCVILIGWASKDFVINPTQGGILHDWRYKDELFVNQIIREQKLDNYNVAMWYDTRAITQRYLFLINKSGFDFENSSNQYLFVVYPTDNWQQDGAYELNTFKPARTIKQWKINDKYILYLAQRN